MTTVDTSWIVIKGFKRLAGFQKCCRIQIFPKIPINANKKYRVSGRIPIQKKVDFNNTATSTIITTTTSDPSLTLFFLLLLLLQYLLLHIHLLDSGHLIVKSSPVITNLLILLFSLAEYAFLIGGTAFSLVHVLALTVVIIPVIHLHLCSRDGVCELS